MNKIESIIQDGFENLQIVLDFDRTITGPVNNEPAPPMISFLRNSDMLGEEYKKQAQANFEHYYKFEKDHTLTHQEKSKLMHEWWAKHLQMLSDFKLTKGKILTIANSENLILRMGVKEFFAFCFDKNIPIIIFSAGILGSESIREFFIRFNIDTANIKIITNELVFESEVVKGFREPIIHSENKDESVFKEEGIIQRKNTILAGDGIGDSKMVTDMPGSVVYRIGVLDSHTESEKEIYLKHFDEVTNNFNDIIEKLK
jgi:5'-nucleotidase